MPLKIRHRLVIESADKVVLSHILDFISKYFGKEIDAYEIRERSEWVKDDSGTANSQVVEANSK